MRRSEFTGEYPFARLRLADDAVPLDIELEAYTPLVPLDADDSGIPAAILTYRVTNTADEPLDVSVAGTLANPVATSGRNALHSPLYRATPTLSYRDETSIVWSPAPRRC